MGLPYYRAAALTDIAGYLLLQQQATRALELLDEAEAIGLSLDDEYFVAGTQRHVGEAATVGGLYDRARDAYDKAVAGADKMPLGQARARALSRVATAMAESGFAMETRNVPHTGSRRC